MIFYGLLAKTNKGVCSALQIQRGNSNACKLQCKAVVITALYNVEDVRS